MNLGAIELTPLSQKMILEAGQYADELKRAENLGQETSKNIQNHFEGISKTGAKMQKTGAMLTVGVTVPLVALGKQAYESYKSFDTAFRGVTKTIEMTEAETKQMERSIRDMAKELPHSVEAISAVAQAAGQLGIEKHNILSFTKTMLNLGVSTNLSAEAAADSIARFANITNMSQNDFERFGSTIVHLGNNFATTEAEIVAMSMRLAGAGAQAGFSEADIAALATTLSSLGIEAEAGGSALSRLINQIGIEVATNGARLAEFARISGKTTEEFKQHWKENAVGALAAFTEGLGKSTERGEDMNVLLDEMGFKDVRLSDAIRRLSGSQGLLTEAVAEGNKAWAENVALAKEADNFNNSVASQQTVKWNTIKDSLIDLGEKLVPVFGKVLETIKGVVEWFTNLDDGTQQLIINFGLLAIAAGPVITVLGTAFKVVGGLGSALLGLKSAGAVAALSQVGAAAAGVSTATAGATVATGGLLSSLGGMAVAAAPWVAGIGAVVGAGVLLHNTLTQEVVPSVDLFATETITSFERVQNAQGQWANSVQYHTVTISEETKQQLSSYLELSKGVQETIQGMYTGIIQTTEENVTILAQKANELTLTIDQANQQRKNEELETLNSLFAETETLTEENKESILGTVEDHYATRGMKLAALQTKEEEIYQAIKESTTGITKEQAEALKNIEDEKNRLAIESMTKNNEEKEVILQRYGVYSKRVSTEQAAEVVKALNQQKDEGVKVAEEEFVKRVEIAEKIRARGGEEANKTADAIIEAAKRQKENTIEELRGIRADGLEKLQQSYQELTENIDLKTGNIRTTWDKLTQGVQQVSAGMKIEVKRQIDEYNALKMEDKTATITTRHLTEYITSGVAGGAGGVWANHYNGLDAVPYDGYTARLHKGEKVLTAREVEERQQSQGDTNITIENVVHNGPQDIKRLAEELDFYMRQRRFG